MEMVLIAEINWISACFLTIGTINLSIGNYCVAEYFIIAADENCVHRR